MTAFGSAVLAAACGSPSMVFTGSALASGGVNHRVKVENRTDFYCRVTVVYGSSLGSRSTPETKIAPHSSGTVETGAKSPYFIAGKCGPGPYPFETHDFQRRCTLGPEGDSCASDCTATCWSSDWNTTCKKTKDQLPLEDGGLTLNV